MPKKDEFSDAQKQKISSLITDFLFNEKAETELKKDPKKFLARYDIKINDDEAEELKKVEVFSEKEMDALLRIPKVKPLVNVGTKSSVWTRVKSNSSIVAQVAVNVIDIIAIKSPDEENNDDLTKKDKDRK